MRRGHAGREDRLRRQRDSDTVTPITTATNTPGKPIKVGDGPGGITITPDGKTVYVANFESGTVTPITAATNTPGKPIKVGSGPRRSRSPRTGRRPTSPTWRARYGDADHHRDQHARASRSKSAAVPGRWRSRRMARLSTSLCDSGTTVTPISDGDQHARQPIQVGAAPGRRGIAITPDGKTAYVANGTPAR